MAATVWDGGDLLFDATFQALRIPPKQCFQRAHSVELVPGAHWICGPLWPSWDEVSARLPTCL